MPKYTFLLPAFKGRFLNEMLRSIQGQTYQDFKVIISDDCSPEDLLSICKPYLEDSRFSYRRNKENMGCKSLVGHWNLLVSMCDTEFLVLASDDDVYEPQFLEEIDRLTEKYPEVDLFRSRPNDINQSGVIIKTEGPSAEFLSHGAFSLRLYDTDAVGGEAAYCYRTKSLVKKGMFVEFPLAWFSDDATNIMMSADGCAITAEPLFNFRRTDIQITGKWGEPSICVEKVKATLLFYKWMNTFLDSRPTTHKEKEIVMCFHHKVYSNIQNNIFHCPPLKFLPYLYDCPNDIGLSKVRMFMHYVNVLFIKTKKNLRFTVCCLIKNKRSMIFKRIIDGLKRRYTWYVLSPAIKRKFQDIEILDSIASINYILEHRCSVSRFGDGEFDLIEGRKEGYQEPNERLSQLLKQVLQSNLPNHMIGIPRPLKDTSRLRNESREFWERYFLVYHGKSVRKYLSPHKTYLDTQLSRFYIENTDKEYSKTIFAHLRKIWDKQNIVIVEGVKTRSGVGNDLYDNANSIQRILGPATNAIDMYDEMLSAIQNNVSKDKLILLSFGPTATILAYDLAKLGYWAIDIGHVDIEYEWMKRGVQTEIAIDGKYTNEAKGGDAVDECNDTEYLSQIICDITK